MRGFMKSIHCNNLICFFDKYNGASIYAAINLKPKNIIFISDDEEAILDDFENIKEHLLSKLPLVTVENRILNNVSYKDLSDLIISYSQKDTVINLSRGSRLLNLLAFKICEEKGYIAVFSNMDNEVILDLTSKEPTPIEFPLQEMNVEDLIASAGGKILNDNTKFYNDKKINDMMIYIMSNYKMWLNLKYILRNNLYIQYSEFYPLSVTMNTRIIDKFSEYMPFFKKCQELGILKLSKGKHNSLMLEFANHDYKSFLFKAGTWLEIIAYKAVKSINSMEDVRAGVVFLWDSDKEKLKNEADVLATANSQLIYISCKDTQNYDEIALNELEVYAEKIGGENAIKILVATSPPTKNTTMLRAEEMGIKIIIFHGNQQLLRDSLKAIIH